MRQHISDALPIQAGMLLTFVTRSIPWGIAFPEVPTTHLFRYPDLGIALINGFVHEQAGSPGIRTALVIDPGGGESNEMAALRTRLTEGGVLTKVLRGARASVYQVDNSIMSFPYDLLTLATHCG